MATGYTPDRLITYEQGQNIINNLSGIRNILETTYWPNDGGGGAANLQSKTVDPSNVVQVIRPDENYDALSQVTVNAIPDYMANVSNVNANAENLLAGKIYVDSTGQEVVGTMPNIGALDVTLNGGQNYIIPQGYHDGNGIINVNPAREGIIVNFSGSIANSYNGPVSIDNNLTNLSNCFENMKSFNQPVVIPNGVTSCYGMFNNCLNMDSVVTLGTNVTNVQNMFRNCKNFNKAITLNASSIKNFAYMFYGATYLNKNFTLPNDATHTAYMFYGCSMNQSIVIPNSVTNCAYMFASCLINKKITIPDSVVYCQGMFRYTHFNQSVTLGNGVMNCGNMFSGCYFFNQPITMTITDRAADCAYMFNDCSNLDQSITLNLPLCNCRSMFEQCNKLNSNIDCIVNNAYEMFNCCKNLNATINITANSVAWAFNNCVNLNSNVYINSSGCVAAFSSVRNYAGNCHILTDDVTIRVNQMFNYHNNMVPFNIFFKNQDVFNNAILNRTSSSTSIMGQLVTWTAIDNGAYNAAMNVYAYYNYTP